MIKKLLIVSLAGSAIGTGVLYALSQAIEQDGTRAFIRPASFLVICNAIPWLDASDDGTPPPLFTDLGTHHYKISTKVAEAQKYFDQGLRLVYGFNHDEARRAFQHAAKLDPDCAIAHWGVAMTLGPNYNQPAEPDRNAKAFEAVQKALSLIDKASPSEQGLIRAIAKRYTNPPPATPEEQKALDQAWADAMEKLSDQFPADLDIATIAAESRMNLRPWDLWTQDGKPQPGTEWIVAKLESVLKLAPNHPGANHYYIHAVEASTDPDRAIAAADRLRAMVPGAAHLVHMPSHIYLRVGRYEDASQANRLAIKADQKYLERVGPQGFYSMYVGHNYHFLSTSAAIAGRSKEAIQAATDLHAFTTPEMLRAMPGYDFLYVWPTLTHARFGQWDQVLAAEAPPEDFTFANAMHQYARGIALVAGGRIDEARQAHASIIKTHDATPESAMQSVNSARALLGIARDMLAARIAAAEGKFDAAATGFEAAASAEDQLRYMEPPDWYMPTRLAYGAAMLKAGKPERAEAIFRDDLARNRENPWSLFGLAAAQKAQGKTAEAAKTEAAFKAHWKGADVTLSMDWF